MIRMLCLFLTAACIHTGCTTPVAVQNVPISSTPIGADVFVDGKLIGKTPTCAALPKNSSHQVTLVKPGYRPECVTIERIRNDEKLYKSALLQGVQHGFLFNSPTDATTRAISVIEEEDATGNASILVPGVIASKLVPENEKPTP